MIKVNPDNENETKSNIFHFSIGTFSNLTPYLCLSKNIKIFQCFSKSKFLSFITKVNPNNEKETKADTFPCDKSNLTSFFIDPKILKYFHDFQSHSKIKHKQSE